MSLETQSWVFIIQKYVVEACVHILSMRIWYTQVPVPIYKITILNHDHLLSIHTFQTRKKEQYSGWLAGLGWLLLILCTSL
jgi:hypothetical protein